MKLEAIGVLELSSIASGYNCQDAMLKAADVELLVARTVCSGKYLVIIAGDVGAIEAAMEAGKMASQGELVDDLIIPNVHPSVFPALAGAAEAPASLDNALGILESFSVASIIEAADAAAKAASVYLYRVHAAMAIGGKGYMLLTGDVAAVEAALAAGKEAVSERGLLVASIIIPRPRPELFREQI